MYGDASAGDTGEISGTYFEDGEFAYISVPNGEEEGIEAEGRDKGYSTYCNVLHI